MLRVKNVVYGAQNILEVPVHIHYGQYMIERFLQFGDDVALINSCTNEQVTYSSLVQQIVDISLSLVRAGIRKGDVVGVCSEERVQYAPTIYGIVCAGATFTSLCTAGTSILAHRLSLSKPKLVFCSPSTYDLHWDTMRKAGVETLVVFDDQRENAVSFKEFITEHAMVDDFVPVPVDGATDIVTIMYSSGTTGLSKAVALTHLNYIIWSKIRVDDCYYRGKRVLAPSVFIPFTMACLHAGSTLVFLLDETPRVIMEVIERYQVQILQPMPSVLLSLLKDSSIGRYDVTSVRRVYTGSAPFDEQMVKAVQERFCKVEGVHQYYGVTEAGVMCTDERVPLGVKPGSVGCALPGVVIKVVDVDTRQILGPLERGELCVKGPNLFKGYIGVDKPHLDADGFFETGDIAYYDEDRYFYIVDRIKDIIKCMGWTIYPAELEAIFLTHPKVREAAVVGTPHPIHQEVAVGFVATQPGASITESELLEFINKQLPEYMAVSKIHFVSSIPHVRGKIDKKALRLAIVDFAPRG